MVGETWRVLSEAAQGFIQDRAGRMGASLAFFTALSLAPFFIFAVSVAGMLLEQTRVRAEVMRHVGALVGQPGVRVTELLFDNALEAYAASSGIFATGLGMVLLLFAASAVLHELRDALNSIFRSTPPQQAWFRTALERFVSVALVFSLGFMLAVSLLFSTALGAFSARAHAAFPLPAALFTALDALFNIVVLGALFGLIYRYLPSVKPRWRDVLPGALFCAVAFTAGKWAFGVFLGNSLLSSAYGAAGSLIVFLLWVFYTAQLFFFGAEIVKVRHQARTGEPEPAKKLV